MLSRVHQTDFTNYCGSEIFPIWLAIGILLPLQNTTMMAVCSRARGLGSFFEYLIFIAANQVENCIERKSKLQHFKYSYSSKLNCRSSSATAAPQQWTLSYHWPLNLTHYCNLPLFCRPLISFSLQTNFHVETEILSRCIGRFISDPGFERIVIYSTHFTIPNVHFPGQIFLAAAKLLMRFLN